MSIERIGVIGAGQMGTGIAHVLSLSGFDVLLEDINQDALGKSRSTIERNMHRQAARGMIKEEQIDAALKHIHIATGLDGGALGLDGAGVLHVARNRSRDIGAVGVLGVDIDQAGILEVIADNF